MVDKNAQKKIVTFYFYKKQIRLLGVLRQSGIDSITEHARGNLT